MAKKVTMKKIADSLGVSVVSVSKAVRGQDGVSEDLRSVILAKADEIGYIYKASDTKKNHKPRIGVLVADRYLDENAFYNGMSECIIKEASRNKEICLFETLSSEKEEKRVLPNMIVSGLVDGVIILGQLSAAYIKELSQFETALIFLDFYDSHFDVDGVVDDGFFGGYLLTSHLIENGYKDIAYIGSIYATSSICDRYLGFCKAMIENGLKIRPEWVIPDRDEDGAFIKLELPKEMPKAFVCNCDSIAYSLIKDLKKEGYRIPEDLAVVGYDDYFFSTMCNPKLTTLRVNMVSMCHEAYLLIKQKIENRKINIGRKVVCGELIVRDSVINCELLNR